MRINSIRLSWFRGAGEEVTLDPACGSIVVYGPNGAGKSSFVDAIEYAIRNGKLAHLAHEYSGRNQEKAIINTHMPEGATTSFTISFKDYSTFGVQIARNGTHLCSGSMGIGAWEYRRTILRQDEVAEFIRSRKGEKYSALLPLFGLHDLEVAAENVRQLARAVERSAALDKKRALIERVAANRKQIFGIKPDEEIAESVELLHGRYCPNSATTDPSVRCGELLASIAVQLDLYSAETLRYAALRSIADMNISQDITAVRDANALLADSAESLIKEKLEVLASASEFAGAVRDGEEVRCPACGQSIPIDDFRRHITSEQGRLREITASFGVRRTAIATLVDDLKAIKTTVVKTELASWRSNKSGLLKDNVAWLERCNPEALRQSLTDRDLELINTNCSPLIQDAYRSCQSSPVSIREISEQKALVECAKEIFDVKLTVMEVSKVDRMIGYLQSIEAGIREQIRLRSAQVIGDISTDIKTMWETLHPGEPIDNVRLYLPDDDKSIDIALRFHGRDQDSPRLTLSEGYRNSLGLCIFLALAKKEADQDRPLFLDDVVVSLDRNHRGMIVQLIEDSFSNRQMIILTHDRDWYADLRQQLDQKRWKFRTLLPFETPAIGIRWSHRITTFDEARAVLDARPDSAGNDARKIMDVELSLAAERLQIRLPYLRADRNDHRTAHDFLERLSSDGKKCFQRRKGGNHELYADALENLDNADRLLTSWGNRASHTFNLVRPEAVRLIDACERAIQSFTCETCHKNVWFTDAEGAEWVQCQCGSLRWRYGKG